MKIERIGNSLKVSADTGKAIRFNSDQTRSNVLAIQFPIGKYDETKFEECEIGEPEGPDYATESDKDAALRRFGVEV